MAFDLGDTVTLNYQAVDPASGSLIAPGTVTLTITQPNGTTVTPSFTTPATGIYQCLFVPPQSGRYGVNWNSVGPATDYTDAFNVNDAAPPYMVSLASAKKQLNIPDSNTTDDEEILEFIQAATEACEMVTGKAMVTRTIVLEEHEVTGGRMALNWSPVQAVTLVQTIDTFITWDPARLHLNQKTGVLSTTFLSGLFELWGRIQVTYTAGFTDLPAKYRIACKMLVEHLWQTRRGTGGSPAPGGLSDATYVPGVAFAIPYKVLELLGSPAPGFA